MHTLNLFFLGPPRLELDGQTVETDTRKAVALLAYLAVSGQRPSRDALAAFLWPDFDERRAKAALRRTLSSLKTAVGDGALIISREAVGLESASAWCDVTAFQAAMAAVAAHQHERLCPACVRHLETAVALYHDSFLAGFTLRDSLPFDDWQLQQSEALRRELAKALEQLVRNAGVSGHFEAGITYARRWLQLDPLREEAQRQLMQLYAWAGQRSAALLQYRACVRVLEEELGVSPLAETTALYQAIQENRLERPVSGEPLAVSGKSAVVSSGQQRAAAASPLIGRQAELAAMGQVYRQVVTDGRLLVLAGEAGIGKTRLAGDFLASLPAATYLHGRCYEGESQLAYAPFVQALRDALRSLSAPAPGRLATVAAPWLAEAARLLPELTELFPQLPEAPPLDWPGAPGRFFEGLSQVLAALLAGPTPGVLWLDDVQWADSASLDLLAYLARRWHERPLLLLLCRRDGERTDDPRWQQLLTEAHRSQFGTVIPLARLKQADVDTWVAATAVPTSADLATRLYQETEGLPFLLTAYLQARADLAPGETTAVSWQLPATARALFQSRLGQAGETGRQLLHTAAVIGRASSFDLLQAASGRSQEETLLALEALLAQQLLVEQTADQAYDFSHHKLRELVYGEMSLVRRRLLHQRVAAVMSAQPGTPAAPIAGHYQRAGQEAEAAVFYRRAGNHARSLFALREALGHYQAALALGFPETAVLHEACGDLHTRLGAYAAALASYERAAANDGQNVAHLEHKIGQVYYRQGQWELAERHFEQAGAHWTETTEPAALTRLFIDWSYTVYRAGDLPRAIDLAARAQALASEPLAAAQTENILGILARSQGHLAEASGHFQRSLDTATAHNFLDVQIAALNNLALAETAVGRTEKAQEHLAAALGHCLTYGDHHWEAALRNNLADVLHLRGQKEAAMTQLKQAVTIYAEIGQEAGGWQPEIWKLMEW